MNIIHYTYTHTLAQTTTQKLSLRLAQQPHGALPGGGGGGGGGGQGGFVEMCDISVALTSKYGRSADSAVEVLV